MTASGSPSDPLAPLRGAPFTKMSGSGNDFVVFDGRRVPAARFDDPSLVQALCDRHRGIGADGVVVLTPGGRDGAPVSLRYWNSDGSLGELCGNATLCSTAQAVRLGLASSAHVGLATDAGLVRARVGADGVPEIEVAPVEALRPDAADALGGLPPGVVRAGFARVGVPHLVLLLDSTGRRGTVDAAVGAAARDALDAIDLATDGPPFRHHPSLGPAGANVNWVGSDGRGGWRYRTFERGVEGETLACGTGAIAIATLLVEWGLSADPVTLTTRSGLPVTVTVSGPTAGAEPSASGHPSSRPTLRGEGRAVFDGTIR